MRLIIILFLAQISTNIFGQKDSFLIVEKIQKIIYHGDSVLFTNPKVLVIETSKTSNIVEIEKLGIHYFGVQYEILESDLNDLEKYIVGKVYFIKTDTSVWKKIVSFNHSEIKLDSISKRHENDRPIADKVNSRLKKMDIKDESLILFWKKQIEDDLKSCNYDTSGDPVEFGVYYNINYYKK